MQTSILFLVIIRLKFPVVDTFLYILKSREIQENGTLLSVASRRGPQSTSIVTFKSDVELRRENSNSTSLG